MDRHSRAFQILQNSAIPEEETGHKSLELTKYIDDRPITFDDESVSYLDLQPFVDSPECIAGSSSETGILIFLILKVEFYQWYLTMTMTLATGYTQCCQLGSFRMRDILFF